MSHEIYRLFGFVINMLYLFLLLVPMVGAIALKMICKKEESSAPLTNGVQCLCLFQVLMILSFFLPEILGDRMAGHEELFIKLSVIGAIVS